LVSLRNAWGGESAQWLAADEAAEFAVDTKPVNLWDVWADVQMGVDLVCQPLIGRRKPCFRRYGQHNDPASAVDERWQMKLALRVPILAAPRTKRTGFEAADRTRQGCCGGRNCPSATFGRESPTCRRCDVTGNDEGKRRYAALNPAWSALLYSGVSSSVW
jgi:hypothetical protein